MRLVRVRAASVANVIRGSDRDAAVLRNAQGNAERAGVAALVRFAAGEVTQARPEGAATASSAPTRRMARGWATKQPREPRTASSVPCCASTSAAGRRRC